MGRGGGLVLGRLQKHLEVMIENLDEARLTTLLHVVATIIRIMQQVLIAAAASSNVVASILRVFVQTHDVRLVEALFFYIVEVVDDIVIVVRSGGTRLRVFGVQRECAVRVDLVVVVDLVGVLIEA